MTNDSKVKQKNFINFPNANTPPICTNLALGLGWLLWLTGRIRLVHDLHLDLVSFEGKQRILSKWYGLDRCPIGATSRMAGIMATNTTDAAPSYFGGHLNALNSIGEQM